MNDWFDKLLPVGTLIIGGLLGWAVQRDAARREARIAAGDLLAEVRRPVWTKGGENDWVDLQVFLGKLRVRLLGAGVAPEVVDWVVGAADQHWQHVEYEPSAESLVLRGKAGDGLDEASTAAQAWLVGRWRPIERRRLRRRAQQMKGLT